MFRREDGSYAMHRICRVDSDGSLDFVGDGQLLVEKGISPDVLAAYVPEVLRKGKIINCRGGIIHSLMISMSVFSLILATGDFLSSRSGMHLNARLNMLSSVRAQHCVIQSLSVRFFWLTSRHLILRFFRQFRAYSRQFMTEFTGRCARQAES